MGKIKNTLAALVLGGALAFSGCGQDTITTQQKNVFCQTIKDGKNVRIMTITSDKNHWNNQQKEIREKLENVINRGGYNIISVKTAYSDVYLTLAEVKYSVAEDEDCDNTRLRVIFIHSDKNHLNNIQEEINPRLEAIVNSGKYNIQEVNSIRVEGYLVAAEVYFKDLDSANKTKKK